MERINSHRRFLRYFFLIVTIIGVGIVTAFFDSSHSTDTFIIYLAVLIFAAVILSDNSGIRSFLFGRLSDKFPFAEKLKRLDKGLCRNVELCKTLSYISVFFYVFVNFPEPLWVGIWVVCEITDFIYIIFDKDTALRPKETPNNGLSAAGEIIIISSLVMFVINDSNFFPNKWLFIFMGMFTLCGTIMYMFSSSDWQNEKSLIILFILGAVSFSFSCFCAVNRAFDFSEPQKYISEIESKSHTSGKNSHYDLHVKDWKNSHETVSIRVDVESWRSLETGDNVTVYEYSGALGMKYYSYSIESE